MKYSYILFALLLVGCGSRKVERHSKSSIEENKTSLQEETKVAEIQFDRKKGFEIMRELNVRDGEITIQPDGTIHIKGNQIDLNSKEAREEQESQSLKEENTNLSINHNEKKEEDQNNVKIDRKQFNWWEIIIPLTVISFLIYIFRKPLKKVSRLF